MIRQLNAAMYQELDTLIQELEPRQEHKENTSKVSSFYNPFTVTGFAKEIAQAQHKSLHAMQRRFPSLSQEALYIEALSTRPGFTREEIEELVYGCRDAWKEIQVAHPSLYSDTPPQAPNFQFVVEMLARREYRKKFGDFPSYEDGRAIQESVCAVISDSV